jgi:hypothetical protein
MCRPWRRKAFTKWLNTVAINVLRSPQRKEILQLQRAGISTASAGALLEPMLDKIDRHCVRRDELSVKPGQGRDSHPSPRHAHEPQMAANSRLLPIALKRSWKSVIAMQKVQNR